jgi:hypothetical protein
MCMIDGADPTDFHKTEARTARKEHRCYECSRKIAPGERYQRTTALFGGSFDHHATCAHCAAAESWLLKHCGGLLWGAVADDLAEHFEEEPEYRRLDGLGRLVVGIKRGWRRLRGPGLLPVPARVS